MRFPHLQFGLLTDVTELNLGRNEITGTMPSEIGYMTSEDSPVSWMICSSIAPTSSVAIIPSAPMMGPEGDISSRSALAC